MTIKELSEQLLPLAKEFHKQTHYKSIAMYSNEKLDEMFETMRKIVTTSNQISKGIKGNV